MPSQQLGVVIGTLSRLLKTRAGKAVLSSSQPYLEAAQSSPRPELRRLAAQQFSTFLLPGSCQVDASPEQLLQHHRAAERLLLFSLQDKDTGIAAEAETGLSTWAASDAAATLELLSRSSLIPGGAPVESHGPLGNTVGMLAGSADVTTRIRLLSLLVAAATKGGPSVAAVVNSSGEAAMNLPFYHPYLVFCPIGLQRLHRLCHVTALPGAVLGQEGPALSTVSPNRNLRALFRIAEWTGRPDEQGGFGCSPRTAYRAHVEARGAEGGGSPDKRGLGGGPPRRRGGRHYFDGSWR